MNNKLYNIGESIVVKVTPKQNGTTVLKSFVDNLVGLSTTRTVLREFRIIEDELFFSDWKELTLSSIADKKVKQNAYIEVRYTRQGTAQTGIIEFQSIQFFGNFKEDIINAPILDRSIFSEIARDIETEKLAKNLFKKLYFRGIIPNYVTRGDNIDINEDEDYITLFYIIAKYFAIIFRFFKRFENFYKDFDLMLENLRQNNIQIDESTISLEQMQFIANHFYDEIRIRGTKGIFNRQGDVVNGVEKKIDGEFIRLIRSKKYNELIYDYMPLKSIGWCLGSSSPLYRGTCFSEHLNKTGENSKDFNDPKYYNLIRSGDFSDLTFQKTGDGKQVMLLRTFNDSYCGIGRIDENENVDDKIIVADPNLDYEITFMFKVSSSLDTSKLHFGVESFDMNKHKFYDAMIIPNDSKTSDWFIDGVNLNNFIKDKWYFVRGIIHAYNSDTTENVKLNIGFGNNLKFNNKFIKYILPKIYISSKKYDVTHLTSVSIWNYKIRPLVRGTNILTLKNGYENSHSVGFIQAPRIFYAYFRNNNNSQSEKEITDIIEKYLLPFNMTDILQFIK